VITEGSYHAKVSGPITEEVDFRVGNGSWWRIGEHPIWILNVGSKAIISHVSAPYAVNKTAKLEPTYTFRFGEPFMTFGNINHPFEALPDTVRIKTSEGTKTLTQVEVFTGGPLAMVEHLAAVRPDEALRACEWHLKSQPDDTAILSQYVAIGRKKSMARVEQFLQAGLDARPLNVTWHRYYQRAALANGKHEEVEKRYKEYLEKEPNSSGLLYLRGSLATGTAEAEDYYKRSQAADPKNPWPSFELSIVAMLSGDWKTARANAERAIAGAPDNELFRFTLHETMLGERDFAALEKEYRAQLQSKPNDVSAVSGLVEALYGAGKTEEATKAADEFVSRAKRYKSAGEDLARSARVYTAFAMQDHATVERLEFAAKNTAGGYYFDALIAQNKVEAAEGIAKTPYEQLLVAVAWHLRGNPVRFEQWRNKALQTLSRDPSTEFIADLLESPTPVTVAQFKGVTWPTRQKALLAAVLAASNPKGSEMRTLARKLNIGTSMPAPLVAQLVDGKK
jgi:tetratricopeptide (TPR) repeat protein